MAELNKDYLGWQRKVTKALLKFCEDHQYPSLGLSEIRECLSALERDDVEEAVTSFRRVPLGRRMGYFDDWAPPIAYTHETEDYLEVTFQALLNEWDRVMKRSLG